MPDWMADPMTWSVPAGRYFGIRVRVHFLFVLFVLSQLLSAYKGGQKDFYFALGTLTILFFSVLFHEFGHCFAARAIGGEAEEVLMWPLGGLAFVSVPNTPRAHFISTIWGPLVNVIICLVTGSVIVFQGYWPPLNPFDLFGCELFVVGLNHWLAWVAITFWLNWISVLFNAIPAFPMDGGRIFRCLLWNRMGFGRATLVAVQVAKLCAIVMGLVGVFQSTQGGIRFEGLLLISVGVFVYLMSERERRLLEAGLIFDDSILGYDFSQGYTSLALSQPKSKARRPSAWERWRRRRERIKRQRELAEKQETERQVDEILAKLHRDGMASLSDQEKRLLTRASEKYRSRDRAGE